MLRFGLFGAGRIGRVHAASVAMHPRAELAVVYDPVEAAAREVAAQYGARPPGTRRRSSAILTSTPSSSPRRRRPTSTC